MGETWEKERNCLKAINKGELMGDGMTVADNGIGMYETKKYGFSIIELCMDMHKNCNLRDS